jgi:hypothetical protein
MLVSRGNILENGLALCSIGRIKASSCWHAVSGPVSEADRLAAVQALVREAGEHDADAVIGLGFEIDNLKRADIDGTLLQRVAATGMAVKLLEPS